jgi:drug/metabolite transporter (DMT)-like permease
MTAQHPAPSTPGRSALLTAILCISAAVFLFSSYNAVGKWLTADYSPWQIMFFRGLFGLIPFAAYALAVHGGTVLRSRRPMLQIVRAGLAFGANLLFIFAYREMPLADAVAIGYAAPVFIVVLSVPLLSERVGIQRASAALVGFVGVVLIIQPGGGGLLAPGALYAIAGTLCYAFLIVTTRRLGAFDSALGTVVYSSTAFAVAGAAALPLVWVTPGPGDLGLLVATGLLGGSGMLLFAHAYRHAEAALLAPFDYAGMLWAGLFGFMLWGELPDPVAAFGMAVIAASGLFLLRHEKLRHLPQAKP